MTDPKPVSLETASPISGQPQTGSPSSGEPVFLVVGKLRRPHGVRGEIVMEILTDFPERLRPGVVVFAGDEHKPLRIRSRRPNGGTLLLAFQDYTNPESTGKLRNLFLYVRADDRPPLPEGEFYYHQLLGIQVVSDEGQELGKLVEILGNPANDIYVIHPNAGPEILLPALKSVILNVDLEGRRMLVHLMPGLLPE